MAFGSDHYVPILKVKRGEKAVLRLLSPPVQSRITPLLEIVERKPDQAPTVEAHLDTAFKDLAESLAPYASCFLDAGELAEDGPSAAAAVFERAAAAGILFVPVTGISRVVDVEPALSAGTPGIALRLTQAELEAGGLSERLDAFMTNHALEPEKVDLIIDLGSVEDLVTAGVSALTDAFLAAVPAHGRWRTFTLGACSFPRSMRVVDRQSHGLVERTDWVAWRDGLHARRGDLQRLPTFSDCAIQHPSGVEGFDFRTMAVSASIRYTLPRDWLLIKGVSTRNVPAPVQFSDLATQLVYGHLRPYFAGREHCSGCGSTKAAADGAPRLGSAEVWRRLGTIHHITRVIEDLDSLLSP